MTIICVPSNMILLGGEVQYRHVFACSGCGALRQGDTRRCDIHELENARVAPQAMPVGWSSHYAPQGNCFFCSTCKPD